MINKIIATLTILAQLIFNSPAFSQTIINTPSINYFLNDNNISTEPLGGAYIKVMAEYFGVAVTYRKNRGNETDIKNSIFETIKIIKRNFPFAKFFANNNENAIFELHDSLLLDFIHIHPYSSYSSSSENLNFYCLIKLDTTLEVEAVNNLYRIKTIIKSIAIPHTNERPNYVLFSRVINEKPILGFSSLETYNKLLMTKITSELNELSTDLIEKQFFEIDISKNLEVTRASLFNCYFFKKYNIKIISK